MYSYFCFFTFFIFVFLSTLIGVMCRGDHARRLRYYMYFMRYGIQQVNKRFLSQCCIYLGCERTGCDQ